MPVPSVYQRRRKGKNPPRLTRRHFNPRERAWHRAFGGIACPPYVAMILIWFVLGLSSAFAGNDFITNDASKPVPVAQTGLLPLGATAITGASGNVANGSAVATLAGASGKTTYITGFQVTASGATAALVVNVAVAGGISGTMTYTFTFPAGVTAAATPLVVPFDRPIPASATNTAITVTLPASGAGGTNAAVNAEGFQL